METIVIGHINPDTDTTCSAIAYAWYLGQKGQLAKPAVAGPLNKETAYVVERFGVGSPDLIETFEKDQPVFIVDTNNPNELLPSISDAKIVGIIDHHKLSGLTTPDPITVSILPVACTATLIFEAISAEGIHIPADIAGVMLACILSDTLNYTSPTTTEADKAAGKALATLAETDPNELSEAMFASKSDISDMDDRSVLEVDGKLYEYGSRKVRISVLETTKPSFALGRAASLIETMQAVKKEDGLDDLLLFVVDIVNSESTLLIASDSEKALAEKAFGMAATGDRMVLPGVVSRKKQIAPKIEAAA
jgi:manganese-dependent inorganic pyrophosphatase